eukprot:3014037-Rhodomonas_salina.2
MLKLLALRLPMRFVRLRPSRVQSSPLHPLSFTFTLHPLLCILSVGGGGRMGVEEDGGEKEQREQSKHALERGRNDEEGFGVDCFGFWYCWFGSMV